MANTLKITKLGSNKFEHIHNGISANAFFISDFSATLDGDKFNIVQNDGSVRFTYKVSDITFLDQTTGGSDEAFVSPYLFWNRLIAVQYTPFFVIPAGLSLDEFDAIHGANSPSASNVFATMADVGGGGGGAVDSVTGDLVDNTDPSNPIVNTPTLQQVKDKSSLISDGTNQTTLDEFGISNTNSNNTTQLSSDGIETVNAYSEQIGYNVIDYCFYWAKKVLTSYKLIELKVTNVLHNVTFEMPDKPDGTYTLATTNDIPDISGKEDSSNKVTTFTGNTTSTTKFPVVKAIVDWVNSLGFITNVITALGYTPANKSGETFTGAITATNLSGNNTGDETNATIISKIGFTPEDSANKSTSTSDSASTTKFPVWSVILAYFSTSRIKMLLGQASTSVDGWLSASDWNTFNGKQDNLTSTNFGTFSNGLTAKTTPIDADTLNLSDSVDSNKSKKLSWLNVKATLKSYFDTLYPSLTMGAYSFRVNNTNATANSTETIYKSIAKQTYTGTITWTGTTAPSGTTSHSYSWQQVGNLVTVSLNLVYSTAGTLLTAVSMTLPSDMPIPIKPDGITSNSDYLYNGFGKMRSSTQTSNAIANEVLLRTNSSGSGYDIYVQQTAGGFKVVQITLQYFTS